jgi:hypothetical protein
MFFVSNKPKQRRAKQWGASAIPVAAARTAARTNLQSAPHSPRAQARAGKAKPSHGWHGQSVAGGRQRRGGQEAPGDAGADPGAAKARARGEAALVRRGPGQDLWREH